MGRALAERIGYPAADLDRIPAEAIESFAGVGYHFHLSDPKPGETVVDLGSGAGMDTFVAALKVGPRGTVVGIDMTVKQRGGGAAARPRRLPQRDLCRRLYRERAPARRFGRHCHQQRGDQPGDRQERRFP
ncbi:methyltransferase domain-containing protein [Mesorhizobium album]|uniref:methyltransferase domain-containing protein n=1 Tax=Mesorhizobium album TaxID=3072314 RepID=UPI003D323879